MLELTDTDNQRVLIRPDRISAIQEGDGCTIVRLAGNFIVVKEPIAEVREKWEKALAGPETWWGRIGKAARTLEAPMRNPITGRTDDPIPAQEARTCDCPTYKGHKMHWDGGDKVGSNVSCACSPPCAGWSQVQATGP